MFTIENKQIDNFLKKLSKKYKIQDTRHAALSFKKYFLPPTQKIFQKDSINEKIKITKSPKKFILFGLNSKDLDALTYLDKIMSFPKKDFFYFQNRKQSIIIGLLDKKNNTNYENGDIILKKQDNFYEISTNTKVGERLIAQNKEFFTETTEFPKNNSGTLVAKNTVSEKSELWQKEMKELTLDSELLKNAVEWSRDSKIWNELAEICLECGICSYVCPLCYCFSLEDKVELNGNCSRCRKWTSCVLPEFSRISGGYNFRPTLKDRYYNWFYHKFVRGYLEYGASECVGCGRCKIYCPAKIDILEVLKRVLKEYKK